MLKQSIMKVAQDLDPSFPVYSGDGDKYQRSQHNRNDYVMGWLAGEVLAAGSNSGNNQTIAEGMFYRLQTEHRTLQHNSMDILFQVIERMADQRTDQRNAYVVHRCRQIRDLLKTDVITAEVQALY